MENDIILKKLESMDEKLDKIDVNTAILEYRVTQLEYKIKKEEDRSESNRKFVVSTFVTAVISLMVAGFKYIGGSN